VLPRAVAIAVEFVFTDLSAESVAVNAEHLCRAGLVAVGMVEHALDKTFLKFPDGFVEQDSTLNHLRHQTFKLIFHDDTLRKNFPGTGPDR
jgi:hypothetical protein